MTVAKHLMSVRIKDDKKNADAGSSATGRGLVILKILQMERKDSRCSSCPEADGVVYVIGDRDAATGDGSIVSVEM